MKTIQSNFKIINKLSPYLEGEKHYCDFESLIEWFENSIHNREGHYIKLDIRYLMDWLLHNEVICDALLSAKILEWKKEPGKEKWLNFKNDNYNKLRNNSNTFVHYGRTTHVEVRSKSMITKISFGEMIEFAKFFHNLIFEVLIELKAIKSKEEFNKEIYFDEERIFNYSEERRELVKKNESNEECKLCGEGKIKYPKLKVYEFGPYLECTNCNAKLSTNLNLKSEILKENKCDSNSCFNKESMIKETYSYKENKKYFECTRCWRKFDEDNKDASTLDFSGNELSF